MTNAEELAKDVDYLVSIISFSSFCNTFGRRKKFCCHCPLFHSDKGCTKEALKEWLESEVEDDAEVH